jgi:hypothetical protein
MDVAPGGGSFGVRGCCLEKLSAIRIASIARQGGKSAHSSHYSVLVGLEAPTAGRLDGVDR